MDLDKAIYEYDFDVDKIRKLTKIPRKDIKARIDVINSYKAKLTELLKIPKIEQKTTPWYEARHVMISASDFAQALGEGKFGTQKDIIIKKVDPPEYGALDNPFFNWGNMFEQVASDLYAKMHNVKLHEFGLLKHPTVSYCGASPDGITEHGRMLEIKCPLKRVITQGADVPTQYYYQIQGQLDVCDLDECDYFECKFALCRSIWEFEANKSSKGVFVKKKDGTFEYGPLVLQDNNLDMTEINNFVKNNLNDNIHYWVLDTYNLKLVIRDKPFIDNVLLELGKVWDKIVYYREHRDAFKMEVLNEWHIDTELANLPVPVLKDYAFIEIEIEDDNTNVIAQKLKEFAFIDEPTYATLAVKAHTASPSSYESFVIKPKLKEFAFMDELEPNDIPKLKVTKANLKSKILNIPNKDKK